MVIYSPPSLYQLFIFRLDCANQNITNFFKKKGAAADQHERAEHDSSQQAGADLFPGKKKLERELKGDVMNEEYFVADTWNKWKYLLCTTQPVGAQLPYPTQKNESAYSHTGVPQQEKLAPAHGQEQK